MSKPESSWDDEGISPKGKAPRWAWGVCWLLFASTMLNYMDRQAVAVVSEKITGEFRLRHEDFGWVIAAFYLPYALFQVPAGFLADRWDVRKTYALAVIWWSLAAIAVAWSPTLGALMAFRALLGVGEAFNWPCAIKVTGTVLPPADRGLGNGIFNSGAAIGAVVTPLVVVPLSLWFGWRVAFAIIGSFGLIWVAVWLVLVNGPAASLFPAPTRPARGSTHLPASTRLAFGALFALVIVGGLFGASYGLTRPLPLPESARWASSRVSPGSLVRKGDPLGVIVQGDSRTEVVAPADGLVVALDPVPRIRTQALGYSAYWLAIAFLMFGLLTLSRAIPLDRLGGEGWIRAIGEIVRVRRFWVLVIGSICINVCWHFLVNFLPTYLKNDRGMPFVAGSLLSALPFLAADVGNLGGGAASRWLARRGMTVVRARVVVLTVCAFLVASGAGVGWIGNNTVVLGLLALMAMGTAANLATSFAYCQDVLPARTGLVVGILGGLGNLFAAGFAPFAGRIKDTTGSYGPVFLIVGFLPFIGLATLVLGWGRDADTVEHVSG